MFKKILLAVDGSPHALRAARVAGDLVRSMKSQKLRIVVAFDPIPAYLGQPNFENVIQARLKEAERILQQAQKAVGKVPAEIHTELIEGSIAEAIINVATTRKSDVIVMGSRGRGHLTSALLGSTSQTVVCNAPCPVLLIR